MKPTHFGLFLLMSFTALGLGECGYKTTTVDSGGGAVTVANPTTTITVADNADAIINTGEEGQIATDQGLNNQSGTISQTESSTPEGGFAGIPGCSSEASFNAGFCGSEGGQ